MLVSKINNPLYKPSFTSSLDNTDYIETQVKSSLLDNFKPIQAQVQQNVASQIEQQYRDEFRKQVEDTKGQLHPNDTRTILRALKDAYSQAGLTDDANAIGNYLNTNA